MGNNNITSTSYIRKVNAGVIGANGQPKTTASGFGTIPIGQSITEDSPVVAYIKTEEFLRLTEEQQLAALKKQFPDIEEQDLKTILNNVKTTLDAQNPGTAATDVDNQTPVNHDDYTAVLMAIGKEDGTIDDVNAYLKGLPNAIDNLTDEDIENLSNYVAQNVEYLVQADGDYDDSMTSPKGFLDRVILGALKDVQGFEGINLLSDSDRQKCLEHIYEKLGKHVYPNSWDNMDNTEKFVQINQIAFVMSASRSMPDQINFSDFLKPASTQEEIQNHNNIINDVYALYENNENTHYDFMEQLLNQYIDNDELNTKYDYDNFEPNKALDNFWDDFLGKLDENYNNLSPQEKKKFANSIMEHIYQQKQINRDSRFQVSWNRLSDNEKESFKRSFAQSIVTIKYLQTNGSTGDPVCYEDFFNLSVEKRNEYISGVLSEALDVDDKILLAYNSERHGDENGVFATSDKVPPRMREKYCNQMIEQRFNGILSEEEIARLKKGDINDEFLASIDAKLKANGEDDGLTADDRRLIELAVATKYLKNVRMYSKERTAQDCTDELRNNYEGNIEAFVKDKIKAKAEELGKPVEKLTQEDLREILRSVNFRNPRDLDKFIENLGFDLRNLDMQNEDDQLIAGILNAFAIIDKNEARVAVLSEKLAQVDRENFKISTDSYVEMHDKDIETQANLGKAISPEYIEDYSGSINEHSANAADCFVKICESEDVSDEIKGLYSYSAVVTATSPEQAMANETALLEINNVFVTEGLAAATNNVDESIRDQYLSNIHNSMDNYTSEQRALINNAIETGTVSSQNTYSSHQSAETGVATGSHSQYNQTGSTNSAATPQQNPTPTASAASQPQLQTPTTGSVNIQTSQTIETPVSGFSSLRYETESPRSTTSANSTNNDNWAVQAENKRQEAMANAADTKQKIENEQIDYEIKQKLQMTDEEYEEIVQVMEAELSKSSETADDVDNSTRAVLRKLLRSAGSIGEAYDILSAYIGSSFQEKFLEKIISSGNTSIINAFLSSHSADSKFLTDIYLGVSSDSVRKDILKRLPDDVIAELLDAGKIVDIGDLDYKILQKYIRKRIYSMSNSDFAYYLKFLPLDVREVLTRERKEARGTVDPATPVAKAEPKQANAKVVEPKPEVKSEPVKGKKGDASQNNPNPSPFKAGEMTTTLGDGRVITKEGTSFAAISNNEEDIYRVVDNNDKKQGAPIGMDEKVLTVGSAEWNAKYNHNNVQSTAFTMAALDEEDDYFEFGGQFGSNKVPKNRKIEKKPKFKHLGYNA